MHVAPVPMSVEIGNIYSITWLLKASVKFKKSFQFDTNFTKKNIRFEHFIL